MDDTARSLVRLRAAQAQTRKQLDSAVAELEDHAERFTRMDLLLKKLATRAAGSFTKPTGRMIRVRVPVTERRRRPRNP
jgi:hypothetical protein